LPPLIAVALNGYVSVMSDEPTVAPDDPYLSTVETAPAVIPAEADEGEITAAESRAKADPDSPAGPDADTAESEFTDPSAQPPA
jgi:hypothetical protein